ncbi:hypothetical protein QC820_09895 [Halomonas mongoliensis]|uniref:Uncharacterized protein n=1 Tax=Halomonas mongoliensis TaxID=321265 RepID=A0ABU1GNV3_9GAMM|nr:hypothetical protein [Halomonas mongoliensis]MDR5893128.1 hypothetical protein [Halomonas mongoliensis]
MERTLFVFEGEKRERQYFQSIKNAFFSEEGSHVLVSFNNDIYELYKELASDEDLDPFEVIRELNPVVRCQEELSRLRRDQIGQIYLFFDMEPCDEQYSDEKLIKMLELFNNETEHGKLFISYPMVEALRDIDDHAEYLTRTAALSDCYGKFYKRWSAERGGKAYQNASKIDRTLWQGLVSANVKKANFIVGGEFSSMPVLDSLPIAKNQLEFYLSNGEVAVLSAFPIFLADYYGQKIYEI